MKGVVRLPVKLLCMLLDVNGATESKVIMLYFNCSRSMFYTIQKYRKALIAPQGEFSYVCFIFQGQITSLKTKYEAEIKILENLYFSSLFIKISTSVEVVNEVRKRQFLSLNFREHILLQKGNIKVSH